MINDLQILNGNLELKFNPYTYEYTVKVDSDIESLEFSYNLEPDCYINIRNNTLDNKENTVYVDIYNIDNTITYTFLVTKDTENSVSGIDDYKKSLEIVNNESINILYVQCLGIGLVLTIIILFSIIFRRKKHN